MAEDFYKDGILHCGNCGEPKERKLEMNGRTIKPKCMCKCEREELKKQQEEYQRQEEQKQIDDLRIRCFKDKELRSYTFESDDEQNKISKVARNYVDNFEKMGNKGLLLFGSVGTGKTFIACCIANALIDKGHSCLVTNFARLVNEIGGIFDKQKIFDDLREYDLLIIDDLASERDTEYMNEIVMNVINERYLSGKPIIVTTNLTSNELKHSSTINKQRVYSRLYEMCIFVEVVGEDRRKEKLKRSQKELGRILGL